MEQAYSLEVNGVLLSGQADPQMPLLWLLRDGIASGKLGSAFAILPAHLLMLGLAAALLFYRNRPAEPWLERTKRLLRRKSA